MVVGAGLASLSSSLFTFRSSLAVLSPFRSSLAAFVSPSLCTITVFHSPAGSPSRRRETNFTGSRGCNTFGCLYLRDLLSLGRWPAHEGACLRRRVPPPPAGTVEEIHCVPGCSVRHATIRFPEHSRRTSARARPRRLSHIQTDAHTHAHGHNTRTYAQVSGCTECLLYRETHSTKPVLRSPFYHRYQPTPFTCIPFSRRMRPARARQEIRVTDANAHRPPGIHVAQELDIRLD